MNNQCPRGCSKQLVVTGVCIRTPLVRLGSELPTMRIIFERRLIYSSDARIYIQIHLLVFSTSFTTFAFFCVMTVEIQPVVAADITGAADRSCDDGTGESVPH